MEDNPSSSPSDPTPPDKPEPSSPAPAPAPAPEPGAPAAQTSAEHLHHMGARRIKWRIMLTLIGLYVFAIGAACILILRPVRQVKGPDGEMQSVASLLSPSPKETVGWIKINGPIYNRDSNSIFEKGAAQWGRRIKSLSETKGIKAIVLDINSPGGSIGAVQEIHSQIMRARKKHKIPFVALFRDVAASGGYYIAAACDKIIAQPGTLTGSIGVIFSMNNIEGLFKKIGISSKPIKSGKYKDIGSPTRPMTAEEREILQELIDDAYGQFVKAIVDGRGMSEEKVRELADGRIYSGNQALENGLIDLLGDSTDALELAGKLGGIKGTPKIRRDTDSLRGILEMLETKFSGGFLGVSGVLESLRPLAHGGLEYRWAGW